MSNQSIPQNVPNKSTLFRRYNKARAAGDVERGRLDRALGVAQLEEDRPYRTTANDCTCPDRQWRGGVCKHMAANVS